MFGLKLIRNTHRMIFAQYRCQHSKSWKRFFKKIETDLFQNRIRRQRPIDDIRFIQYENIFSYYVLSNHTGSLPLSKDDQDIPPIPDDWFRDPPDPVSSEETIRAIGQMNLDQISRFMITLADKIPMIQQDTHFNSIFIRSESPVAQVWRTLDSILVQHLQQRWPHEKEMFLKISHLWFELGLAQNVQYNGVLVDTILADPDLLEKSILLHLMFLLNLTRFVQDPQKKSKIITKTERFFLKKKSSLNFYELSVIGNGFFKTQTRMSLDLLRSYIDRCIQELYNDPKIKSTIAVASVLKVIRFSLESIQFDARQLKRPISLLVEALGHHQSQFLESEICLTHLILLTNSAFLFDKNFYRHVFRRMMANLPVFRIKDIERILLCLSNARSKCPETDLARLEQYLVDGEECHLYPYVVYNIVFYLILIDYYPQKLLKLSCKPEFLEKSISTSKLPLASPLLAIDTILKLRFPEWKLLNSDQIHQFRHDLAYLFRCPGNRPSVKERFLKLIEDSLRPEFGSKRFQMMYILPFVTTPYPVILNEPEKIDLAPEQNRTLCPYPESIPYRGNYLRPNFFRKSLAILPILDKEWTVGSNLRGFTHLNKCLLEDLGFKTVLLEQKHFRECLAITHPSSSDSLKVCKKRIVSTLMTAMNK